MLEGEPNFILRSNFHHILVNSATIFHSLGKMPLYWGQVAKKKKKQDKPKPAPVQSAVECRAT